MIIGGDAIEARRHVPPQILASSFVIILALTSLCLAYCREGTFPIHFATEAIYCIAHKATGSAYRTLLCLLTVNASAIMSPPAAAAAAAVMTIAIVYNYIDYIILYYNGLSNCAISSSCVRQTESTFR